MPLTENFLNYLVLNGYSGLYREDEKVAKNVPTNTQVGHLGNLESSDPTNVVINQNNTTSGNVTVPGTGKNARLFVTNNTELPQTSNLSLSTALTKSTSNTVTTTTAVTSSTGFEVTVGVDTPFASVSGTITGSLERTNSSETSNTTGTEKSETVTVDAALTVPPDRTYLAQVMYQKVTANIPYTFDIGIKGPIVYRQNGHDTIEGSSEIAYYDKVHNVPYAGVNLNNLSTSFPGQPAVGQPYIRGLSNAASLNIPGMATLSDSYDAYVKYTIVTPTSSLLTSSEGSQSGASVASVVAAMPSAASSTYYAPSDTMSGVGDYIALDASHTHVVGTPLGDEIQAGPGNDVIDAGDGDNLVYGGSDNDVIMAEGSGVNTFIGGTGNALFRMQSSAMGNLIEGGQGSNWIIADAPSTTITGGPGNDVIQLSAQSSGGSVITDHVGINALTIGLNSAPLRFEQDGEGLIILLNGDQTFNAAQDVVWTDFFESAHNSVNGMNAAHLAKLTQDGAFNPTALGLSGTPGAMGMEMLPGDVHAQSGNSSLAHAFWLLGQQ